MQGEWRIAPENTMILYRKMGICCFAIRGTGVEYGRAAARMYKWTRKYNQHAGFSGSACCLRSSVSAARAGAAGRVVLRSQWVRSGHICSAMAAGASEELWRTCSEKS